MSISSRITVTVGGISKSLDNLLRMEYVAYNLTPTITRGLLKTSDFREPLDMVSIKISKVHAEYRTFSVILIIPTTDDPGNTGLYDGSNKPIC
jgi:cysteinyl-tRNA synthetase